MGVIRIKRRASGAAGAPASLKNAELAYNEIDNVLYYGSGNDGSNNATAVLAIAGLGGYVSLTADQTIQGVKTYSGTLQAPTVLSSDSSTNVATTAFVKNQNYLLGNEVITVTGDVTGSGSTTISLTLADVVTASTAAKVTFNSKGLITGSSLLDATDIPDLTTAKITDLSSYLASTSLSTFSAPTSSVNFNSQTLTNLADPVNPQDAATKAYVDAAAQGLDVKESVRALSDTNITLSGEQTIDDVSLLIGDRVLVTGQTNAAENGIYIVDTGAWTRSSDADNSAGGSVTPGMFTFIEEGTLYGDSGWVLATDGDVTVGTTALLFTQFNGSGQISAGDGLTKSGSILNVVGTADRITANADHIDIASTYAGQSSITTLGTISTGTWNGSLIGLGYGGAGADLSVDADGTIYKKVGAALVPAIAGTDFLEANSTLDGGTF